MAPKIKISRAMFDVRPIDKTGYVDFVKIENLADTVVLRKRMAGDTDVKLSLSFEPSADSRVGLKIFPKPFVSDNKNKAVDFNTIIKDFEKEFSNGNNLTAELARAGANFYPKTEGKFFKKKYAIKIPKASAVFALNKKENDGDAKTTEEISEGLLLPENESENKKEKKENLIALEEYLKHKSQNLSPVEMEVNNVLEEIRKNPNIFRETTPVFYKKISFGSFSGILKKFRFKKRKRAVLLAVIPVFLVLMAFKGGIVIKNDIINRGNNAVANLERAKSDLETFNFLSAAENFSAASDNFSGAADSLNLLGASFASLFSEIPGLGKIKDAKNLVKAGENIAQAGKDLSLAFNNLFGTNFVSYFGSENIPSKSLTEYVYTFRNSFIFAKKKIDETAFLLAGIDSSVFPEDKQEDLVDFKEKIPQFQKFSADAVDYSDFLLDFIGSFSPKRYLILFQNNSELRPTGGFPGTYGILEFEKGFVKKIFVDDVYNIDGQISKNIVPPLELQHITPVWGMRDANWFIDFPTSARKVMEMYQLDGGQAVDGVLSVTPTVISNILKIVGPIEMPEYGIALDSENFLSQIQEEVEYGDNRKQPKKIVADFTPKFFEKLAGQERGNWVKVFEVLANAVYEKHILGYFKEPELQEFAVKNGIGGEIKEIQGDFLMVVHTNIKGSKTDAVIDNSIDLATAINDDGFIEHTLKITRSHNGGKTSFGFYDRQNPDYVRILLPLGSTLLNIEGNSAVSINPLVSYDSSFMVDDDLEKYESSAVRKNGIKIFPESGKTAIGFWMLTKPGKTKEVLIKYLTPIEVDDGNYSILVQKQPATDSNFHFSFDVPDGKESVFAGPNDLQVINGDFILNSNLSVDRAIDLGWK